MPTKTQPRTSRRKSPKTRGQEKKNNSPRGIVRLPASQNSSSRQSGPLSFRPPRTIERIATVVGSAIYDNVLSIPTQPGLVSSFPWLSTIANSFEEYRVISLTFRYKNIVGASNNGNVILSYDLDVMDSAPLDGISASQSTFYKDGAPWRIFELKVRIPNKRFFTRSATIANADPKLYDCGILHVATEGCTLDQDQGYLEVEYDIELIGKQPQSFGSSATSYGYPTFAIVQPGTQLFSPGNN